MKNDSLRNGELFLSVQNPVVNLRHDRKTNSWRLHIATLSEGNWDSLCFEEPYDSRPDIRVSKVKEIYGDCVTFTGYYEIRVTPKEVAKAWHGGKSHIGD